MKHKINLNLLLIIWWCPCLELSLVLWGKAIFDDQCVLLTKLLTLALLHFVLQVQTCLLFWYLFTSYFCIPIPYNEKTSFWVLVLQDLYRTSQLLLLHHQWLGHRLGLLWCWMVYVGNKLRSFCHFWGCTQVLHFRLFCWLWGLPHFF